MKNLYLLLSMVLLSFQSNAQIVNVPDANLKNYFLSAGVDHNHNGEIEVNEALTYTNLDLSSKQISDMTGIEAFTNLVQLYCNYNTIATIDVSTLTHLELLSCHGNKITGINVTGMPDLEFLSCSGNLLTALDVTNNTNLKTLQCGSNLISSLYVNHLVDLEILECDYNMISSLEVSALTNLTRLSCVQNGLTSLDVSNSPNLVTLSCSSNQLVSLNISNLTNLEVLHAGANMLTSLDFTGMTKLKNISLYENLFTTLDFSPLIMTTYAYTPYRYKIQNNPNLNYVNVKNGTRIDYYGIMGVTYNSFDATGCPNLAYICADESNFENIIASVPDAVLNSYCSFTPGGIYNTIAGTYTLDIDGNGCDANDMHFDNGKILIDDSLVTGSTFSNASGNYSFFTQAGSFVITPEFENPYFTVSPASATISFADSNSNIQTQNFCITPNGIHNNVEITILPLVRPRPGFDTHLQLIYKNKGNQVLSGNINFTFDDAVLDFVSSNPAPAGQATDNLNWNYDNLLPFESRLINVLLNVNSPQEIPPVNIGNILTFHAVVNPISGDNTANDNTFTLREAVVGSFDPNDKTCLEGAAVTPDKVGGFLNYIIRFENAGNAVAENIVVADMIDAEKFDINSLQLVASSHPHTTRIIDNKVEFIFEGINLPAGIDDEAGSHGYVAFKVKTKNTLAVGDAISNTANIYFDYNFPVTTNTATTTVTTLLAAHDFEDKSVSIFPNPVKDQLHIAAKRNITSIQLFDFQGRLIETNLVNATESIFNFGNNANGIYFIKIYTDRGVKVEKIIKE